jgi:esterase/lipase superfamily enzyme
MRILLWVSVLFYLFLTGCLLTGCGARKTFTLMPTPIIYQDSKIDPFAHLTAVQKSTKTEVFYATNRVPRPPGKTIWYSNEIGSTLHFGQATIDMGGPDGNWEGLLQSTFSDTEEEPVVLTVDKVIEATAVEQYEKQSPEILTSSLQAFIESINTELAQAVDKVIMVYVHGTKVDFANSIILTAEVDHFAGRDFVGVAFAWPSHQNILSYLLGRIPGGRENRRGFYR